MIEIRDQLDRLVQLPAFPQRIISTVPSQTELLFDLGLGDRLVGITKFCVHPNSDVKIKKKIGGTKNLNLPLISTLKADLIVANKEENTEKAIGAIEQDSPVYVSNIQNVFHALQMIEDIGRLTNTKARAEALIGNIKSQFEEFPHFERLKILYLIWKDPYMVAGPGTFIDDILARLGFVNESPVSENRYPVIDLDDFKAGDLDLILLSSEPYPFRENHAEAIQSQTGTKTILVNGEMFSWYGSRMALMNAYFHEVLKKSIFK